MLVQIVKIISKRLHPINAYNLGGLLLTFCPSLPTFLNWHGIVMITKCLNAHWLEWTCEILAKLKLGEMFLNILYMERGNKRWSMGAPNDLSPTSSPVRMYVQGSVGRGPKGSGMCAVYLEWSFFLLCWEVSFCIKGWVY